MAFSMKPASISKHESEADRLASHYGTNRPSPMWPATKGHTMAHTALRLIAVCLLLVGTSAIHAQPARNQPHTLRIYVTPLEGSSQGFADMVTAKLIGRLVKHGLSVVESEEDADAILTGAGMMQESTTEHGHTRFHLHAGMRLVLKDKGTVIWADDIASSKFAQALIQFRRKCCKKR